MALAFGALLRLDRPYALDEDVIRTDLTTERPIWILSSYGPGKNAPAQLFGGLPRERSFEEMRWLHYDALNQNRLQDALQEARSLNESAQQQVQSILANLRGAVAYVLAAENQHPNRIDQCKCLTAAMGCTKR